MKTLVIPKRAKGEPLHDWLNRRDRSEAWQHYLATIEREREGLIDPTSAECDCGWRVYTTDEFNAWFLLAAHGEERHPDLDVTYCRG